VKLALEEQEQSMQIVNGYQCRDCTDVSYAKKNIDPAHPKDGPVDGAKAKEAKQRETAVEFGGALSGLRASDLVTQATQASQAAFERNRQPGARLSITV
jgi:hypothetical protein